MTETQWNEFLDKLDFVELTDRWKLLPLHWLDQNLPDEVSDSARDMVAGLLQAKTNDDEAQRLEQVKAVCQEYRNRLSSQSLSLDSRLTPPGS